MMEMRRSEDDDGGDGDDGGGVEEDGSGSGKSGAGYRGDPGTSTTGDYRGLPGPGMLVSGAPIYSRP